MVKYISVQNSWHRSIATFWVRTVVSAWDYPQGRATESLETYFFVRAPTRKSVLRLSWGVPEANQAAGYGWDWVALIVHPHELSDLGVKEYRIQVVHWQAALPT
jgi:hypothetical protein